MEGRADTAVPPCRGGRIGMSGFAHERTFWGPLTFVRFTPRGRHTEAQCPLFGLKRTIFVPLAFCR